MIHLKTAESEFLLLFILFTFQLHHLHYFPAFLVPVITIPTIGDTDSTNEIIRAIFSKNFGQHCFLTNNEHGQSLDLLVLD